MKNNIVRNGQLEMLRVKHQIFCTHVPNWMGITPSLIIGVGFFEI